MKNSVILFAEFSRAVSRSREIFIETFVETFSDSEQWKFQWKFDDFLTLHVKIRQVDTVSKSRYIGISKISLFPRTIRYDTIYRNYMYLRQAISTLLITVVQSFSLNFHALFSNNVVGEFLQNIVHVKMSFVNLFNCIQLCFLYFLIALSLLLSFYDE